ncbi:MAG: hypothetical protein R2867_11625 [Caldilineaceae bacterium]
MTMNATFFDLQGYLVVPNALSKDEVAALNAIMDARIGAGCRRM